MIGLKIQCHTEVSLGALEVGPAPEYQSEGIMHFRDALPCQLLEIKECPIEISALIAGKPQRVQHLGVFGVIPQGLQENLFGGLEISYNFV